MDSPGVAPRDCSPDYRRVVERLYGLARFGMKLGLDRMEDLLRDLGHPERAYRSVHVAGSNGKGSTCAFLASILAHHGLKVGIYSSPHLISLVERVQILQDDKSSCVSEARIVSAVAQVEAVRPGLDGLTFFEVMTAAGLVALKDEGVQLAVIEAGLGARLDATKVVPAELGILTDLSLEHTAILGETIEEIAADEGQVARLGRPLVAADGPAAAMPVIESIAADMQANLHRIGDDIHALASGESQWAFDLGQRVVQDVRLSLKGAHQSRNALLAAKAATLVEPGVSDATLRMGLSTAVWPGRMEVLPGPNGVRFLLDGAQNPHAAVALAAALASDRDFEAPLHFVFGVLSDKDAAQMLVPLARLATSFCVTRPDSPRAQDPHTLTRHWTSGVMGSVIAQPDVGAALHGAAARAELDGGWVVVCGSLYLVGDARARLLDVP